MVAKRIIVDPYEKKYLKYKTKYIATKNFNKLRLMKGGNGDFANFNSSILGFGTDGIEDIEAHKNILYGAINVGYRTFDLAEAYGNVKIIGQIINDVVVKGQVKRENLFINYKIRPVQNVEDDQLQIFYANIDNAINIFSYLDCLMFHNTNFNNPEILNNMLVFVQDKMRNGLIKHIGLSNLYISKYTRNMDEFFDKFVQMFGKYGMKVEVIQEKFNHTMDKPYMIKLFKYCKENGIKVMVYGALGGKFTKGTCMNAVVNWQAPLIEFNPIGYPNINQISQKYNLDKYMLVLAFQSYKYDLIQIPITFNINRLQSNYQSFNKAYELSSNSENNVMNMITEDLRKIDINSDKADLNYVASMINKDKKLDTELDTELLEIKLKSILKFKSRLLLLKNVYETNSVLAKFFDIILPYYEIKEYPQILRSMLRLLETVHKYDDVGILNSYLNNLNIAMINIKKNPRVDLRSKIDLLIPTVKIEQFKMADYSNYMFGEIRKIKDSLNDLSALKNIKIKIINDIPEEQHIFLYYESVQKMYDVVFSKLDLYELFLNIESNHNIPISNFIWNNTKNNDFYKISQNLKPGDLIYVGNDQNNYNQILQNINNISFTTLILADNAKVCIYLLEQEKVIIVNMAYSEIYNDDTLEEFLNKVVGQNNLAVLVHTKFNYDENISNKDLIFVSEEQTKIKFKNIDSTRIVIGNVEKLAQIKNPLGVTVLNVIDNFPPSKYPEIYQYFE